MKPWPAEPVGMSESDLLQGVLDMSRALGWRTVHIRRARTALSWRTAVSGDGIGWPDLFAVRGSRIVAGELKVGRGRVTPEQAAWLDALRAAGVECHVWREADFPDRVLEALR